LDKRLVKMKKGIRAR